MCPRDVLPPGGLCPVMALRGVGLLHGRPQLRVPGRPGNPRGYVLRPGRLADDLVAHLRGQAHVQSVPRLLSYVDGTVQQPAF